MKNDADIREALGFDDVLLVPSETGVKPQDVTLATHLTKGIALNIPLISAGRDNVTESLMAIAMARLGGLGVIHGDMPLGKQVEEVRKVKRAEGSIVQNPITISPDASVAEAIDLMTSYKISGLPVVEQGTQKVLGILTSRDVRFFEDYAKPVSELMTKQVITIKEQVQSDIAKRLMHERRIEKLVLVDDQGRCTGLMTVKDIERLAHYPAATRDKHGRLRVGASVTLGKDALDRTSAMADAGLDVVFIDVAHAHTREAIGTVSAIRQQRATEIQVVAGNVTTADAARSLVDAGADAVTVGMPCTTRDSIGFGMPQLTALLAVVDQCSLAGVPVIIDGGIRDAATLAKALAAGAGSAMLSCLLAGCDEAPGSLVFSEGQAYKAATAPQKPISKDPYRLSTVRPDTSTPYRGAVAHTVADLLDGLKSAMAYAGGKDVQSFSQKAQFVKKR